MEQTFSKYNKEQGKKYNQVRRDYHPDVYDVVLKQHKATGGGSETLLDVGCGPGIVLRGFAPNFVHAIGLDPSEGMLSVASSQNIKTSTGEEARFEISSAEELGRKLSPPIQDSSVDLITAGNAAHWFDMPHFWISAARVLKSGGSVALWTSGRIRVDPSMPNAAAVQDAMDTYQEVLTPYYLPGNLLTRDGYADLPLPWNISQPVEDFDESTFFRKKWKDGEKFFVGEPEANLDMFEKMLATGSPVERWRQANPDAVGTERDVVRVLRRSVEKLLHETGVEKGEEKVRGISEGVLLMVKKK